MPEDASNPTQNPTLHAMQNWLGVVLDSLSSTTTIMMKAKILWDILTNILAPLADEGSDLIGCMNFFTDGHPTYGYLSFFFLIAPAIAAVIIERDLEVFIQHLPVAQIATHQEHLKKTRKLQNTILEKKLEVEKLKKARESNEKKIQALKQEIRTHEKDINAIKTELQRFKILGAILESIPQFVIQSSFQLKNLYAGQFEVEPLAIFQICTSIFTVFTTFTGLTTEMPFMVGDHERPPVRSLSLSYGKIFPLIVCAVTPHMISMVAMASFATLKALPFYALFGGFNVVAFVTLAYFLRKWILKKIPADKTKLIKIGLITTVAAPCVIGVFESQFLLVSSIASAALHSIGLGIIGVFAKSLSADSIFYPIANDNGTVNFFDDDQTSNKPLSIDELSIDELVGYLDWYMMVLIPALLSSIVFYRVISAIMTKENKIYRVVLAIDNENHASLEEQMKETPELFNENIPGDEDDQNILAYACAKKDELGQMMIEDSDLDLDLGSQRNDGKTPLMIAAQRLHIKSFKALIEKAKEGQDIKINAVENEDRNSALHLVAKANGPFEQKLELFKSMVKEEDCLGIELFIKNKYNKRPQDIIKEEHPENARQIDQLFVGEEMELKALHYTIDQKDFEQFIKLDLANNTSGFPRQKDDFLSFCIKNHETLAAKMIKENQGLALNLDHKKEKCTPLYLACKLKKIKVLEALLTVAKDNFDVNAQCGGYLQDTALIDCCKVGFTEGVSQLLAVAKELNLDINATKKDGTTALIAACAKGCSECVSQLLAVAKEMDLDVNAKTKSKETTAFIAAAQNKQGKVMDLMVAESEKLSIDLSHKDESGKSAKINFLSRNYQDEKCEFCEK